MTFKKPEFKNVIWEGLRLSYQAARKNDAKIGSSSPQL